MVCAITCEEGSLKFIKMINFDAASLRAGLVHLVRGVVGAAMPPELTKISYQFVVVEVEEDCTGLHAFVCSQLVKDN